jgi:hypothetical protein
MPVAWTARLQHDYLVAGGVHDELPEPFFERLVPARWVGTRSSTPADRRHRASNASAITGGTSMMKQTLRSRVVQWIALIVLAMMLYLIVQPPSVHLLLLFTVAVGTIVIFGGVLRAARTGGLGREATGQVDWRGNRAMVFDACARALETIGARDIHIDAVAGTLRARRGRSRRSWGEVLLVRIRPVPHVGEDGDAIISPHITITSRSLLPTTLADWGQNRDNVGAFLSALQRGG